jgi:hypothetical protein
MTYIAPFCLLAGVAGTADTGPTTGQGLPQWPDRYAAAGHRPTWATAMKMTIEIVSRRDQHVFEISDAHLGVS